MNDILLKVINIADTQLHANSYMVILEEVYGNRRLPIVVGFGEAQAIAIILQDLKPARPLTHDLFVKLAKGFNLSIESVSITALKEATFFAQIHCTQGNYTQNIDARSSDAIALAMRFDCPIYTNEAVMEAASIVVTNASDDQSNEAAPKSSTKTVEQQIADLELSLTQLLANEDYEGAASLRDKISQLKDRNRN